MTFNWKTNIHGLTKTVFEMQLIGIRDMSLVNCHTDNKTLGHANLGGVYPKLATKSSSAQLEPNII